MNYILGAISAPYQYYKDLPPLNPSTLTGAIDVIVVQRPTPDGSSELACSPFHVRIGKWHALRPADRKVNVSVNGHPIPFNMKVGEAGEAFFVFEAPDDVSEDLITSPILHPTRPDEPQGPSILPTSETGQPVDRSALEAEEIPEPEFLDLNAMPYVGHPPPSSDLHTLDQPPLPSSLPTIPALDLSMLSSSPLPLSDDIDNRYPIQKDRANSEPPPDISEDQRQDRPPSVPLTLDLSVQAYSWAWGAFPQPSPMAPGFGKRNYLEGWPGSIEEVTSNNRVLSESASDREGTLRSRSVPPELEGSPASIRHELPKLDSYDDSYPFQVRTSSHQDQFGSGGRLSASKADSTSFIVTIDGRKMSFELSLIDTEEGVPPDTAQPSRQRFPRQFEVEDAQLFDQGMVTYSRFMEDKSIVNDERLVIRWGDNQYITRSDGSPLMNALLLWRDTTIKHRYLDIPSRPASPSSDEESVVNGKELSDDAVSSDERDDKRTDSQPLEQRNSARKPSSSSWVRWWRRGKIKEADSAASRPTPSFKSADLQSNVQSPQTQQHSINSEITASTQQRLVSPRPEAEKSPRTKKYAKTLRLSSDQLRSLNLKPGANSITFSLSATGAIACTARIFVWDSKDVVVISDIDGTITKSDGLGHVFAMLGRDWTHVGVAKLYSDIARNGYKLLYLTSRAIGQADATRGYLKGINQNNYQLPEGPVIMSPDRLIVSLHREVIMRKPEVFKMACLRDIQKLFGDASRNPFYAGFGNRITDALSYRSVDVPSARIFTIDSTGVVKMELLELAGYKSSYIHMTDLVDQMFPPIHRKWANDFTDFNYWKAPVQDFHFPDLSPPSPALSARSDASNQSAFSRLRNFSLVPNRYTSKRTTDPPSQVTTDSVEAGLRASTLQQMSSFERLGAALAGLTISASASTSGSRRSMSRDSRTSSWTYADTVSDEEYGEEWEETTKGRRRARGRSLTSMPGSLGDIHFTVDDEDNNAGNGEVFEGHGEDDYEAEVQHLEEANDEALDEDVLATTQMKNVPFL